MLCKAKSILLFSVLLLCGSIFIASAPIAYADDYPEYTVSYDDLNVLGGSVLIEDEYDNSSNAFR